MLNRKALAALVLLFFIPAAAQGGESPPLSQYLEIQWEQLVPASWHPEKIFEGLNLDELADGDPRAVKILETLITEWNNAPVNPEIQDKLIKLPGFVAPLDWEDEASLREFLLVPYFGACIHVPPPPANQIVYIKLDKGRDGLESMAAIWVYGKIFLERHTGGMGTASYAMRVDHIEPYTEPLPQ
ncbi:MAG: DUF3299 domain-containing protein [Deltaproteobacteria bacterium]|jgi:hypothetical protein|nr:DUF3299 domain-containing protein [Deltaproteobacteria bacterium]